MNIEQSEVSERNAQQILGEAIAAYDENDYAQALFLFEALEDIGYQTRMVNIEETIAEIQRLHAREEKKRLAAIDYEEIAIFARSQRTLKLALTAFSTWKKQYPEFVTELDTANLSSKLEKPTKPMPRLPRPKASTTRVPPRPTTQRKQQVVPKPSVSQNNSSFSNEKASTDFPLIQLTAQPKQQAIPKPSASQNNKSSSNQKSSKIPSIENISILTMLFNIIIIGSSLMLLEIFLPNNSQMNWIINIQAFFTQYWVAWWFIVIVAFGWAMLVSAAVGSARVKDRENDLGWTLFKSIFYLGFVILFSIPSVVIVFFVSDGILPLSLIGLMCATYFFPVPIESLVDSF